MVLSACRLRSDPNGAGLGLRLMRNKRTKSVDKIKYRVQSSQKEKKKEKITINILKFVININGIICPLKEITKRDVLVIKFLQSVMLLFYMCACVLLPAFLPYRALSLQKM